MTQERINITVAGHNMKVYTYKILVYKQAGTVNFYFHACADSFTGTEILHLMQFAHSICNLIIGVLYSIPVPSDTEVTFSSSTV